jgi:hypothetical protein
VTDSAVVQQVADGLLVVLLTWLVGGGALLACSVLLLAGKATHPWAAGFGGALLAFGFAGAVVLGGDVDAARSGAWAQFMAWPIGLLAFGASLLVLAAAGLRSNPRDRALALRTLALVLAVSSCIGAGGWWLGNWMYPAFRALVYGMLGGLTALACLGGAAPETRGGVAEAATVAFLFCVASGEASGRGMVHAIAMQQLSSEDPERRALVAQAFLTAVRPEVVLGCVTLVLASLPLLLICRSRRRWAALAWPLIALAGYLWLGPGLADLLRGAG